MTLDSTRHSSRVEQADRGEPFHDELWRLLHEKREADRVDTAKPVVTEQKLSFRGSDVVLKSLNGKPSYYKDGDEEWDSKDGQLWIKRGTDGLTSWRGTVSFDDAGNVVEEGKSSGVRSTRRKDGSATTSITTEKGVVVKHTEYADGKQEFEGSKKWTSNDGTTWRSGTDVYYGSIGIDAFGRFWRQHAGSDRREYADRSAENKVVLDKMQSMEKKYNISFGTPGTVTDYEYKDPEKDAYVKVPVTYRFPTADELNVLERCLKQYAHLASDNSGASDFGGLRFNFLSGTGQGYKADLYGWYNSNKEGISQISFAPRNSLQSAESWEALRGTALHEIAHHLQHKFWKRDASPDTPQKVQDAFSFKFDKPSSTYRLEDKDGQLWERQQIRVKDKDTGKWEYRGRWYPVIDGVVIKEESRSRSGKQMHDALPADKKPCTLYFTYPTEAHAEALSMYLFDRRMLLDKNPTLYDNVKSWDQEDINRRYGTTGALKTPNMVRALDGTIVPNTAQTRQKIQDTESTWRKSRASTEQRSRWEAWIDSRNEAYENL